MAALLIACAIAGTEIPAQFTSVMTQITPWSMGKPLPSFFAYDRTNGRMRSDAMSILPFVPKEWIGTPEEWSNTTQWSMSDGIYFSVNNQTRKVSQVEKFADPFSWLPFANLSGSETVDGKLTDVWASDVPNVGHFRYYVSHDGIPVRHFSNVSYPKLPGQPPQYQATQMDFTTYKAGVSPQAFAGFNKSAALFPPACPVPSDLTPVTLDVFIFHPEHSNNISGQDVGDAVGDASFVCQDALTNNTKNDNYSVVSMYTLEVYPQFGQYKMCNHYDPSICIGDEPILVGKEASMGLGVFGGQCSYNDLAGTWYSLPPSGLCANNTRPTSPDVCTWRIVKKIKTIDSKCLFNEHKMLQTCIQEVRLPYPKSTEIFVNAFKEVDPAKGGCPAL